MFGCSTRVQDVQFQDVQFSSLQRVLCEGDHRAAIVNACIRQSI